MVTGPSLGELRGPAGRAPLEGMGGWARSPRRGPWPGLPRTAVTLKHAGHEPDIKASTRPSATGEALVRPPLMEQRRAARLLRLLV